MRLHEIVVQAANYLFGAGRLSTTSNDVSTTVDIRVNGPLNSSDPIRYDVFVALMEAYNEQMFFGMNLFYKKQLPGEYQFIVEVNPKEQPAHDALDIKTLLLTILDAYSAEQAEAKTAAQAAIIAADDNVAKALVLTNTVATA